MSEHHTAILTPNDLEALAAFVEGRLAGTEKKTVVARLATDEDYYEVYAETLRFLEEEEEQGQVNDLAAVPGTDDPPDDGSRVLPMKRLSIRALRRPALLAAAALVPIAAALTFVLLRTAPTSSRDYLKLVDRNATLPIAVIAGVEDWRRVRGGSTPLPPGLGAVAINTRIGVRQIDLAIAMDIGSVEEAQHHARRLDALMNAGDLPLPVDYRALFDALDTEGTTPALDLARQRLATDVDTRLQDAPGYQLGLWLQTCRVAAAAGDPAFFNRRATRRALRQLDLASLLPSATAEAQRLDSLLRRGVTSSDLKSLGETCYALVVAGGNRGRS